MIEYPKGLTLNSIRQDPVRLEESDGIEKQTDLSASLKLVDTDGRVLLLIETEPRCIDACEPDKNIMGCYIRRFEYVADFFRAPYSSIRDSFISAFKHRLIASPVPLKRNGLLTYYSYIWAEIGEGAGCVITELLDMPVVSINGHIATHKKLINR